MELFQEKKRAKNLKNESLIFVQKSGVSIGSEIVKKYELTNKHFAVMGKNSEGKICLFIKKQGQEHPGFYQLQDRKESEVLRFIKGKHTKFWDELIGNYKTVKTKVFNDHQYGSGLEILLKKN